MQINLTDLYQELTTELRAADLHAAELRGQVALIERLIRESQQPIMSGDPIGEPLPNGREVHTGPLV